MGRQEPANAAARHHRRPKSEAHSQVSFRVRRKEWRGKAKSPASPPSEGLLTCAEHLLFTLQVLTVTVPMSLMRTLRLSKDQ